MHARCATLIYMPRRAQVEVPEPIDERALTIYVDGSMRSSPRRGGIGILFVWVKDDGHEATWDHSLPATIGANNQEMELEAPSDALKLVIGHHAPFDLSRFDKIVIRTDSEYVHGNLPIAISTWRNNRWTKKGGGAVLNVRDWKNLLTLMRRLDREYRLRVHFEWKKGKKGKHAKAVDKLAKASSDSPSFGHARPNVVRRKKSPHQVEVGSVRMDAQVMTIRVIQSQYLPPPRRSSRYKYEVVDKDSPSYEKVDWAESDKELKRGHTYSVRMNADQDNPRIEEVLEELEEDLSAYLEALRAIGRPATALEVADELKRMGLLSVSRDAARRRLDRLADELGNVRKTRSSTTGRPYLYKVAE